MKKLVGSVLMIIVLMTTITVIKKVKAYMLNQDLQLEAYRETSLGGWLWLGLYSNQQYKFGYTDFWGVDIKVQGVYHLNKHTLLLYPDSTAQNEAFRDIIRFLRVQGGFAERPLSNSGITFLTIVKR